MCDSSAVVIRVLRNDQITRTCQHDRLHHLQSFVRTNTCGLAIREQAGSSCSGVAVKLREVLMKLGLLSFSCLICASSTVPHGEQVAEAKPCWNLLPDGSSFADQCNCTACIERGSNWRYFTNPHIAQMTGGLAYSVPSRYCLKLNSSGHPIRPANMRDYEWKPLANATSMINESAQCPEILCPMLRTCGDCTRGTLPSSRLSAPVPCTWRGPAPALANRSTGSCMFIGDTGNFTKMVKWNDFPSMEDLQSRRNCSIRGLLPRNRTYNLCSSTIRNMSDSAATCAKDEKVHGHANAVCLRGGGKTEYDCRAECDMYGGACIGVKVLKGLYNGDRDCFACLLFEECLEPMPGEQHEVDYMEVSMGPPVLGDWINSPSKCPGGCEGHRVPGLEVPPMDTNTATYYRPWYADPKRCFEDARCKFCTLPFPSKVDTPLPHRVDDVGCYDKHDEPEDAGAVKPYCAWDKYLGQTPETACAQHTTYAACAGSYSIGCQWCLARTPAARFRQLEYASNSTIVDLLTPQCVYYVDAIQGCLSMNAVHNMPVESQIPLVQLFEKGKLDSPREQSCGSHQMFTNMLGMVSDNASEADPWYTSQDFDVSATLDFSYIPMHVPKSERERQLGMLKRCAGDEDATLRVATKECQQVFASTCSRCLRTPGCWWRDNGLKSRVAGKWSFDLGSDSFLPGCFPANAQQTYVSTVTALSSSPDLPLRSLTVPEDSDFCFDPCWQFTSCGSCLGDHSGQKCQWCDYPDNGDGTLGSVCTSVHGPYHVCQDKFTRLDACPSKPPASSTTSVPHAMPLLHTIESTFSSGSLDAPDSHMWYASCIGALSALICLPLLIGATCVRLGRFRLRRKYAPSQTGLLADAGCENQAGGQACQIGGAASAVHHSSVQIDFFDLGFRAKIGNEEKQILRGVSGSISSGQFLAVMGPSGSGKTTFLDVLAKRKLNLKACDGNVCVNGKSIESHVRSYTGWLTEFVPQQDTLLAVHTVTEMLRFVADLKLPRTTSSAAKDERVREVIAMVGLEHRAEAYIGSNLVRGLSGGERRRAMIASALVSRAPVLFLDEPTSGLSSTDSLRVVQMLGTLAKTHGYAVIAVVHQPQSRLFDHFDKLLLLTQGEVCYMGSADKSVAWFERITGTSMPSAMNPADWLLDIITPGFMNSNVIVACKQQLPKQEGEASVPAQSLEDGEFPLSFDLSTAPEFATGRWKQFRVILHRCFQSKIRGWQVLLTRFAVNLGVAIIAGSALPLEWPMYVHAITGEPSRQLNAVLFFVVTFQGLIALTVLPLFSMERELFAHERKAKFYRVFPYFVANCLSEWAVQAYSSLLFGAVFYVIVSPSYDWSRFLFYLLTTVLVGDCASSFAQCCSSASRSIVNSLALCAMGLGCFLLFSGFLMLPSSMPTIWKPTYHASFWKYGFQALTINEYANAQFPCQPLNYSFATQCPPFNESNSCPIFPCMNKSSGHAAAVHKFRRFSNIAEVHNAFLTSGVAGMFLGSADARQVNCRFLCGPEEAPGRCDGDDCVCSSFSGCRNDTSDCDPFIWKENKGMCPNTRHLNGVPANGSCSSEIQNVAGEYFLDALGFGRLGDDGKPSPENSPDLTGATTSYVRGSPQATKYMWLGALVVIMATFRTANFALILLKRD